LVEEAQASLFKLPTNIVRATIFAKAAIFFVIIRALNFLNKDEVVIFMQPCPYNVIGVKMHD